MSFTEVFDYLSLLVALTFSSLMLAVPANYARILFKNRKRLNDPDVLDNYGVLYHGLKRNSTIAVLTYQLFLLRRFLMVVVLCFFVFSVHVQIALLIAINHAAVLHVVIVRPFTEL